MIIIGLAHTKNNLNLVGEYILSEYPDAGKVMIEKDPLNSRKTGFGRLEGMLLDDGKEVIRGDIFSGYNDGITGRKNRFFDGIMAKYKFDGENYHFEEEQRPEILNDLGKLLVWTAVDLVIEPLTLFSGIDKRNKGMIQEIVEKSPDISVVGYAHAAAIKKGLPFLKFVEFTSTNDKMDRIDKRIGVRRLISAYYGAWPDEKVVYKPQAD